MGNTLLRTTSGKRFFSFVLSLMVAVTPILCSAHPIDLEVFEKTRLVSESTLKVSSLLYSSDSLSPLFGEVFSDSEKAIASQEISPVIAFTAGTLTVKEDIGAVNLRIELLEANNTRVEVEIAFLPNAGTATFADIAEFQTQTIVFSPSDASGTIKNIRVSIFDDNDYEQSEMAVFRLQNISAGSIAEPSTLTLEIQDDDRPDIVINEIFANPIEGYGDTNGDGRISASDDQFVELVNNESNSVDISGWTISDDFGPRFSFPKGTELPSGNAAVVFGGGSPAGNFGGASVFTAVEGLGIDKTGDMLYLRDQQGNIVEQVSFNPQGNEGESLTRGTDITGSLSMRHTEVAQNRNRLFSPGMKADGTSFGYRYALRLGGAEGWRLLSSPTRNTTFEDLLGDLQMNTSTVSNQTEGATVYEWREGNFRPIDDLRKEMEAGRGYAVYIHEDDDPGLPGIQGGFPKIIYTNNPDNNSPVSVSLTSKEIDQNKMVAGGEGWDLLGNPFGTEISVSELLSTIRRALQVENRNLQLNGNIYVWDPAANGGNGDYLVLEEHKDHKILPFQAFWIKIENVGGNQNINVTATLERENLTASNSRLYKESNREEFGFSLTLGEGSMYDDYQLAFNREGAVELDIQDAFKLHSINSDAISLYSRSGDSKLMKNVLPYDLTGMMEIPLHFDANGREVLNFGWEGLSDIPDNWSVILTDKKLNKEINLRSVTDYRFTVSTDKVEKSLNEESDGPTLVTERPVSNEPRFILTVNPGSRAQANGPDLPESVKLNPNYPNPFNPATTISFELKEDSEVLLSIWNIVGQRVVTLVDGMKEAGEHTATWNASEMPSGIYIAQLEVGGEVFIRKMTLIK